MSKTNNFTADRSNLNTNPQNKFHITAKMRVAFTTRIFALIFFTVFFYGFLARVRKFRTLKFFIYRLLCRLTLK